MFMKGHYYFQVIARICNVAVAIAEVYTVDGHCFGAPLSYKDLALKLGLGAYIHKHASFERNRLLVARFFAGYVATKNYMTGWGQTIISL